MYENNGKLKDKMDRSFIIIIIATRSETQKKK